MSGDDWAAAVGHALYGDDWHDGDLSDGLDDLVPLIDQLGPAGWSPCGGGNRLAGIRAWGRTMCSACGAMFSQFPGDYVPRHDSPSVEAVIAAAESEARA